MSELPDNAIDLGYMESPDDELAWHKIDFTVPHRFVAIPVDHDARIAELEAEVDNLTEQLNDATAAYTRQLEELGKLVDNLTEQLNHAVESYRHLEELAQLQPLDVGKVANWLRANMHPPRFERAYAVAAEDLVSRFGVAAMPTVEDVMEALGYAKHVPEGSGIPGWRRWGMEVGTVGEVAKRLATLGIKPKEEHND